MEKIGIIGLGWFGLPLAENLKDRFKIFGTSTSEKKVVGLKSKNFEVLKLDLNLAFDESLFSIFLSNLDYCVLNIPPSKIHFQSYKTKIERFISCLPIQIKVIFISSTSVYSDKVEIALEESSVLTDYNFTSQLYQTERMLKQKLGENLTILRFGGLVGENRDPSSFLAGKKNLKNPNLAVNLVHLTDCIGFVNTVLEKKLWGETYNICCSDHPGREEYYVSRCKIKSLDLPEFDLSEQLFRNKIVSNDKSRKVYNYTYFSPFDFD
jgi:hypothetical protein